MQKAFSRLGEEAEITRDPAKILSADGVILPGVGAFGDAMEKLRRYELTEVIRKSVSDGQPVLGICLGLQLLFDHSEETKGVSGLGILEGDIVKIPDKRDLKIPHIGWNSLDITPGAALFRGLPEHPYVYFVHSYYLRAKNEAVVAASTEYGAHIHAAVECGNLFACQFHPEKSGDVGMEILRNFASLLS